VCNLETELRIGSRINERELGGRMGGVELRECGGSGEEEVLRKGLLELDERSIAGRIRSPLAVTLLAVQVTGCNCKNSLLLRPSGDWL
jgi:hypothetical protein